MALDTARRNATKRCHWVPRAYLKTFAADSDTQRKIWRFGVNEGDPELKDIKKVAVRHHLYVPKDNSGQRDDRFEKKLADLETWFASDLWASLCDDMVDLTEISARRIVALLAATLWLRTPRQLELQHSIHAQLVAACSSPLGLPDEVEIGGKVIQVDPTDWLEFRNAGEDDIKRMWIAEMSGASHYAEMLMGMRWSVICADDPSFITTDAPVTFVHPSLKFRGLRNPETRVLFPISPKRLLMMDNRVGEPDGLYYPLTGSAAPFNLLLWREAIGHIFSSRHTGLVCAELIEDAEREGVTWHGSKASYRSV